MRYPVILEKAERNYGAYVPDLPGCVAVGETKEETLQLLQEAIKLHLEKLNEDGISIPMPSSTLEYIDV